MFERVLQRKNTNDLREDIMPNELALYGGTPIRNRKIYYGKQSINEGDILAVENVLRSDWLTQGPKVLELENLLCKTFNSRYAISATNGTSALHLACLAIGVTAGDEVITSPFTFVASANCIRYCGGIPVFADVLPSTYNIDPESVKKKITKKTKAVIAVDYAGQPVQLDELRLICNQYNLVLIEDAAHSLGSKYKNRYVGSIADITTFSFHPVKTVTGGEGGAVLTNHTDYYKRLKLFATHGITKKHEEFTKLDEFVGSWYYEQLSLGYNFRMTEMQAALIINQIKRLPFFKERRRYIWEVYNDAFAQIKGIQIPFEMSDVDSCWHLYVIGIKEGIMGCNRKMFFDALSAENVQPQVHYIPVYYQPYYQELGYKRGECPICEDIYNKILSLPLYPAMTDKDIEDVIGAVVKISNYFMKVKNK